MDEITANVVEIEINVPAKRKFYEKHKRKLDISISALVCHVDNNMIMFCFVSRCRTGTVDKAFRMAIHATLAFTSRALAEQKLESFRRYYII